MIVVRYLALMACSVMAAIVFSGPLIGCHGFKAAAYATMTGMAGAAGVAAEKLPALCEARENAAVDAATSRTEAIEKSGAVHARCKTTLAVLKPMPDGLTSARDAVHDAPAGADLSAVMPWVRLVVRQYCDAVPLLAAFGYALPTFPGVC